jgi:hypothetical protein
MPTYKVTAPDGRTVKLTGDSPPSEAELEQVFSGLPQASTQTGATENTPQGSALGRFVGGVAEVLNPVEIAKGVYQTARHPIDTVAALSAAQTAEADKAREIAQSAQGIGDYSRAAGHAVAAALPILGPIAAQAGERIGAGDIAGGLGMATGLLAPMGAPAAARGAARVARAVPAVSEMLEGGAAARVADVMAPKVGANKVRFGNMAEKVAPVLAKELAGDGAPITRTGFHQQIGAKLAEAEQALDAAADARLQTRTFSVKDILSGLEAKRAELTAKAVGRGKDVVPAPNAARVAVIDRAIKEIRQVRGPFVQYEPIRTMRQAYDGPAKAIYSPAVTPDFLKAKGHALGSADVASVLREELAKWDPQTAEANARYSLYRTADDVLSATAEVERTRPKVGRQIMARLTGAVIGGEAGGAPGAVAGYVFGPAVDAALTSGFTTQLKTAALMQRLATAIRSGDVGRVHSLTATLKRAGVPAAAQVGRLTSPSLATETAR